MEIPWAPFLYTFSTMYCMTVSLALDGEGLGTMWGRQKASELLAEAGFTDVQVKEIDGDAATTTTSRGSIRRRSGPRSTS